MPILPISKLSKRRIGAFEKLETRNLMATLFYEDVDPLTPSNFTALEGVTIYGPRLPWEFHSGNTLFFTPDGSSTRLATTRPISVSNATIEFRLRLGDGSRYFGKLGESEEITLVALPQGARDEVPIKVFTSLDQGYFSRGVWNLAKFVIPPAAESPGTIFKWYQNSFSTSAWGMDEIKIVGDPFQFRMEQAKSVTNTPVESLQVDFLNPIDPQSLTTSDFSLLRNGVLVPLDNSVTIQAMGGNKFSINGLTKFTQAAGKYTLTLRGETILDATGNALQAIQKSTWINDHVAPVLLDVIDVSPDPRSGIEKGVSTIDVVFSEPIDLASFSYEDLSLHRDNGTVDLVDNQVVIQTTPSDRTYRISNLQGLTALGGKYVFSVDGAFKDLAGNIGRNLRSDSWLANDPPVVAVGGTLVFPEDSRPLAIAGAGLVTDADSPDFRNGNLIVTIVNPKPTDVLAIFNRPTSITRIGVAGNQVFYDKKLIGTFSGGKGAIPLVIALNAHATVEAVQALLRNINYQFTGDVPVQESRILQVVAEDGEGGQSRTGVMKVLLSPVNDDPVLALNQTSPISYARNTPGVLFASNATISDVDNPDFYNGTLVVQVVSGRDSTEVLGVTGQFSILNRSVRFQGIEIGLLNADGLAGRALTIRFNAKATQTIVQELLRSISFSTLQNKVVGLRTIDILLRDGRGGVSNTASIDVNVL